MATSSKPAYVLITAAQWLLELPAPTHHQLAAAATLLLEASRLEAGYSLLAGLAREDVTTGDIPHDCYVCGQAVTPKATDHYRWWGHWPEFRQGSNHWRWSPDTQSYQAVPHPSAVPPWAGDVSRETSPEQAREWAVYGDDLDRPLASNLTESEASAHVAELVSKGLDGAHVARQAQAPLIDLCGYSEPGQGTCAALAGHRGDHVTAAGDVIKVRGQDATMAHPADCDQCGTTAPVVYHPDLNQLLCEVCAAILAARDTADSER